MTPAEWNSLEQGDTVRDVTGQTYIVLDKIRHSTEWTEYVVVRSVHATHPYEWTFIKKGSYLS